jgi:polyphosphate glucokinase
VEGETKSSALKKVIENKNNPLKYPAILIKNAVWYIDQAAGNQLSTLVTLCIDIGGTGVKMLVLDNNGHTKTEYKREPTPHPATYVKLTELLKKMIHEQQKAVSFDRVSAGFPGVIIDGIVNTAHNLDPSWLGKNLQKKLEHITGKPARVANDADVQGMGDICGKGVELVITLGTGVGSALFINGELIPNLQLAHHPFIDNKTYEDFLGEAAYKEHGKAKWNTYLQHAIALWQQTFNYHHLYLGGGYAKKVTFVLPENVKISNNIEGVLGGVKLWST